MRVLKRGNRALLSRAFDHPRQVVLPVVASIALAVAGAAFLPRAFLPPFNEGTLLVGMQYNPGISLAESHRLGFAAERLVMTVPEVTSVGRRTGRAELDSHAEGVHASELDIDLERSDRPKEAIFEEIREKLSVLPVSVALGQPISHRIDHMLSGVRAGLAIKIFGPDLDVLRTLADQLNTRLKGVSGLVDLNVEKQTLIPQIRVRAVAENACALRHVAGAGHVGGRGAVQWKDCIADQRRRPALRCRHPAIRCRPIDTGFARRAHSYADRLHPA